ncbi:MAG TPA: hypothetical protein VGO62_21125 [Myxococcota bacterium]|jgi:hypothetical protein
MSNFVISRVFARDASASIEIVRWTTPLHKPASIFDDEDDLSIEVDDSDIELALAA